MNEKVGLDTVEMRMIFDLLNISKLDRCQAEEAQFPSHSSGFGNRQTRWPVSVCHAAALADSPGMLNDMICVSVH